MIAPAPPHDRSGEAFAVVAAALAKVAPDVDVDALDGAVDLREEAELDSLDFLNVVGAVHEATGLEIPERDYPHLGTLDGFVAYVASRWPG